jgi:hypothetical protein
MVYSDRLINYFESLSKTLLDPKEQDPRSATAFPHHQHEQHSHEQPPQQLIEEPHLQQLQEPVDEVEQQSTTAVAMTATSSFCSDPFTKHEYPTLYHE